MPRTITIFLAAPPGDSIRVAREHFHEYVKPILVAGALDWKVVEGRREGEVRASLAKKIRKLRKQKGENSATEAAEGDVEEVMQQFQQPKEWDGIQGDLVLGRHTWKEYMRGLHEGWLGPLDPPSTEPPPATTSEASGLSSAEVSFSETPTSALSISEAPSSTTSPELTPLVPSSSDYIQNESADSAAPLIDTLHPEDTPTSESASDSTSQITTSAPSKTRQSKPSPTPPFIKSIDYPSTIEAPSLPSSFAPSLALPLPHLLGFVNTPTRVYRFLTQRHLAEETGASVAALVLVSSSRLYRQSTDYASTVDPDEASPSNAIQDGAVVPAEQAWEQRGVLKNEEQEWHQSAWKENEEGKDVERVWQEEMAIDERIARRMRAFELGQGEAEKAVRADAEKQLQQEDLITRARKWFGWEKAGKGGWDMGLEGNEDG